ncbi:LPS export ABC transporter permease LptG [Brackiella oedipodis]|uniref:LPS export ABC transporter permease LptG n=1 Tax=Brackiella oedipodis TaxID=124225 RepID=UPI00048E959E|nr:LPS export ABC transporter permease LptG [Brackiella oedipodis]
MKTARHYLAREIYRSTAGCLFMLVALFLFFDMIENLDNLSKNFTFWNLLQLQAISIPKRMFDMLPIALLIGAVISLASLVQRNEITILRVSGVSSSRFIVNLWLICIPLMIFAALLSEFITPYAETKLAQARLRFLDKSSGSTLSTGFWFRENLDNELRIINVVKLQSDKDISQVRIINLDSNNGRIKEMLYAQEAHFTTDNDIELINPIINRNVTNLEDYLAEGKDVSKQIAQFSTQPSLVVHTTLTPKRLQAGQLDPDRMSTRELLDYIDFLKSNNSQYERQTIAIWRKLSYPFTLLVMITLAAPIAFIQSRKGGVGAKIFFGILLGLCFFMINQLSLNVGMLNNLPAWLTATLPNIIALIIAFTALFLIESKNKPKRRKYRHV